MRHIALVGTLGSLREHDTAAKVLADGFTTPLEARRMFEPLHLHPGTYQIHGIGGADWMTAAVLCKVCARAFSCHVIPVTVTPLTSPFDLMRAVDAYYATFAADLDRHHVFFETLRINVARKLIIFGMGS